MPNLRDLAAEGVTRTAVDSPADSPEQLPGADKEKQLKKLQFVSSELKRMRYFRRQYDLRRANFYRQYLGQREEKFYPDNVTKRSNTFVPYPFSNVENIISRVMDAFFSMEEWFEVKDKPPTSSEDQADQMQMALQDKLHKAKAIPWMEEYIRNLAIYGHAGIKIDWDFSFETVTSKVPIPATQPVIGVDGQPAIDPMTGQPATQPVIDPTTQQPVVLGYKAQQDDVPKACPRFTVIDVYDLLVDPDGAYVAHLTERTWRDIQSEQEASLEAMKKDPNRQPAYFEDGLLKLKSRLANEDNPDEIIIRLAEFWNKNDNTWTIMTFGEDPEGISFKDLRASFRATAYSPYKRRIYGGETIMLFDGPNPFNHKRSPILYTSFIKLPNEVYGLGAIEIITDVSEALNRFVNMISDNWNIGINHRYAFDINAEIDHESLNSFNVPGGKVGVVGNPNEVIFPLPQFTPAAGDYQILEVYRGMIEMASGVSDFYSKGVGGSAGNKTATGIQQIIGESNYRLKMFIRNLEVDVLQPMLEMSASMIQQFVDQPWSVSNPKADAFNQPSTVQIDPKALIGTYQFGIVAANYANNKMMQQRNLMALANILAQSPYINEYEAIREMLKVFGVKHIDKMLKTPEQVQQEQQQQMQQQLQMMLLENQLETDRSMKTAAVKGAATPPGAEGGPPGGGKGKGGGRPAKMQFEGKVPGAGLTQLIRELGGNMGASGSGLEGMGEVPPSE